MKSKMSNLICPITREVFRNPVVASDGYTYEECALKRWFRRVGISPLTRERLDEKFMENKIVKNLVKNINDDNDKHPENCLECSGIDGEYLDIKNWGKNMFNKLSENQLKILIDNTDLESVGYDGNKPIHLICRYSTSEMIRYIIDKGVDLEAENNEGWKSIHLICRYSTLKMIRLIIDKGVDLEAEDNEGWRPIHFICRYSTPEMIKYIIDKGVDLEAEDNEGWRPIHFICKYSFSEMIKFIIDKGVDLEAGENEGQKPIHIICEYSTLKMIKYIIDKGVDLESADNEGWKPIHYLCKFSSIEAIKYLVDKGVKTDDRIVKWGGQPANHSPADLLMLNKKISYQQKMDYLLFNKV